MFLELMLCDNIYLAPLAESSGPVNEEDRSVGLWEKGEWNHGHAGVDETNPKSPPPAYGRGTKARYNRRKEGAERGSRHESSHGSTSGLRVAIYIRHSACHDRDRRTGKGTHEQAENEESRPVGSEGTGESPYGEHNECGCGDPLAAELFAEGTPNDWTLESVSGWL